MIALDTNILLRYLVEDDDAQAALARRFIETHLSIDLPGFISTVALIECIWVLDDTYRTPRDVIVKIVEQLLMTPQIVIENKAAVLRAVQCPKGDLADLLIHETGKDFGATKTITFDKKFARLAGVELLA